jgi:hypothetical protein
VSGGALFAAQATTNITDFEYVLKIIFVISGAILDAVMQTKDKEDEPGWDSIHPPPGVIRFVAALAIVAWIGGMITGRLIAYL